MRRNLTALLSAVAMLAMVVGMAGVASATWYSSYAPDTTGTIYTFLSVSNLTTGTPHTVTFTFYDLDGNALTSTSSTVAPGATWRVHTSAGFDLALAGAGAGRVEVETTGTDSEILPWGAGIFRNAAPVFAGFTLSFIQQ